MNPSANFAAPPLRVAIIDDEPTARRGVRLLLTDVPDMVVVGEAGDGARGVELIQRERPDVVFLDVQMPEADGFEVIKRLEAAGGALPAIVFVTAYDEHALRAFEVNAIDYLLKPYDDDRFHAAVERARRQARERQADGLNQRLGRLLEFFESQAAAGAGAGAAGPAGSGGGGEGGGLSDRILVKSSGEIFFLKPEEIDWVEAEGDYMKFHVGGKTHLMRETMARLEARLDGRRFVRIHRSTIVNIERVRKLTPSFAGEYTVVLQDGTKLKLSRGYQDRLQAQLKNLL